MVRKVTIDAGSGSEGRLHEFAVFGARIRARVVVVRLVVVAARKRRKATSRSLTLAMTCNLAQLQQQWGRRWGFVLTTAHTLPAFRCLNCLQNVFSLMSGERAS